MNKLQKEKAINQTIERFKQLKKEKNTKIPCGFCGISVPCRYCIKENIWGKDSYINACLDFISEGRNVPHDWEIRVSLEPETADGNDQKVLNAVCNRVINRMQYLKRKIKKEGK